MQMDANKAMANSTASYISQPSSTERVSVTFTSGNDFYDDGYNERELNADIHAELDFRNVEFFGRSHELQQLTDAFDGIVRRSPRRDKERRRQKQARQSQGQHGNRQESSDSDGRKADPSDGDVSLPSEQVSIIQTQNPNGIPRLPAVFLWGLSGTGKSRLVEQFAASLGVGANHGNSNNVRKDDAGTGNQQPSEQTTSRAQEKQRAYIIRGKNDESTGSKDPFSAIIQALDDFCQQVINGPDVERERMAKIVRESLGEEVQMMAMMVPSIMSLVNSDLSASQAEGGITDSIKPTSVTPSIHSRSTDTRRDNLDQMVTSSDRAWNKLQYVFGSFIKAIATRMRPVIMFLDDMQWSSQVALDLLSTLLQDKTLDNFLLVGTIRQEINPHTDQPLELDSMSPLANMLDRLYESQHRSEDQQPPEYPGTWPRPQTPNGPRLWTDIHLSNMTQQDVGLWLSQLLDREADELQPLAAKIHSKTDGNIFFMLQLLEELERCNAIVYSRISFQWEWHLPDDESLGSNDLSSSHPAELRYHRSTFAATTNVMQLMVRKLNNQPAELRTVLIIASYIRFSFDFDLLQFVLTEESKHQPSTDGFVFAAATATATATATEIGPTNEPQGESPRLLLQHLEHAVLDGLLSNTVGSKTFRFAHDRIQQAALSMIPFGETRSKLKQRIGMHIWRLYCQQNQLPLTTTSTSTFTCSNDSSDSDSRSLPTIDTSLLFVAADHLNCIPTKDHAFSLRLNLEVGQQALKMAAMAPAAMYLQLAHHAFHKLRNPWEDQYDLSLRLHQLRSDVELTLGHYQLGYELGHMVLEKANTTEQKLPVYSCMVSAYAKEDKQDLCVQLSRRTIRLLAGYPRRAYALHAARDLLWLTSYLKRHSNEQILSLPALRDTNRVLANKFMFQLIIRSFLGANLVEWMMASMKVVRMSIRHGICAEAALGFVSAGMVQTALGNQAVATRLANLASAIIRRDPDPYIQAWVDVISGVFIYGWNEPAGVIIEKLHRGFSACMQRGDFETGFFCWQSGNMVAEWEGHPMPEMYRSYQLMLDQMALFKVSSNIEWFKEHAKLPAILIGKEEMNWDDIAHFGEGIVKTKETAFVLKVGYWTRQLLTTYFQRFDVAKILFERLEKSCSDDPIYNFQSSRLLYIALMAASLYRQTKRPKYKRQLKQVYKSSRSACATKGDRHASRHLIIRAEYNAATSKHGDDNKDKSKSTQKSIDAIKGAFYDAIFASDAVGRIHEAGLACERFADYLIMMKMESDAIIEHVSQACSYYHRWGVLTKVDDLRKRYSQYIDDEQICRLFKKHEQQPGHVVLPTHLQAGSDRIRLNFGGSGQSVMVGSVATKTTWPQASSMPSSDSGSGDENSQADEMFEDDNISILTDHE